MKCGNCGSEFDLDEAVEIGGTNRYSNESVVIAHECPGCGESLSKEFTRRQNAEKCGCSATVDISRQEGGGEVCSECGRVQRSNGEIKAKWAIPASEDMVLSGSDAEEYWY